MIRKLLSGQYRLYPRREAEKEQGGYCYAERRYGRYPPVHPPAGPRAG